MPERRIGITATVPVEILFAAGCTPVDLNNLFINDPDPLGLVSAVEDQGFPQSYCAWIKGIYAVASRDRFGEILIVTQGDCSNTLALSELLAARGLIVYKFAYPYDRQPGQLVAEMAKLADSLGTDLNEATDWLARLASVREKLGELDNLTWQEYKVMGEENLKWLVASSDFQGNPESFERKLDEFLNEARERVPKKPGLRLALTGVPPILGDLYEVLATLDAGVVLNEMPRQFSMPDATGNLAETYLAYTYPYDIFHRLDNLEREVKRRKVDGILHYVQSFCYRQLGEMLMRERIDLPILTVEADRPGEVSDAMKTRLEAFIEMLKMGKSSFDNG
ncbi:MAG: 2-hydroxyacyl-CoA dehydratase [Planctomycetota bacterium]|nr:MAG: 2-hydroxyacyl-CoA dehydratase [Planctomycetota bacterium]